MQEAAQSPRPTLLPLIRYRDPKAAVEWLGKAFGFETRCVASGADKGFSYAHLAFGNSLVMVTPERDAEGERLPKLPATGKLASQSCYFVVDDVDAHFERAKEAGAEIVHPIKSYEHGGKRYACRDPEGHVWTFGTYDPWKETLPVVAKPRPWGLHKPVAKRLGLAAAAVTAAVLAVSAWQLWQIPSAATTATPPADVSAGVQPEETGISVVLERTRDELAKERTARAAAEAAERQALAELTQARTAREAAEAAQRQALAEFEQQRSARQEAQRSAEELSAELASARATRAAAEHMASEVDDHLAHDTQAARAAGSPPAPVQITAGATDEAHAADKAVVVMPSLPSNPLLADAQAAMARGDVARARRRLKVLAEQGVADAALALGSTYDPKNLERAGLVDVKPDRAQAKQWYRRALELAQAAAGERQPTQ